jgi:TonB family protein
MKSIVTLLGLFCAVQLSSPLLGQNTSLTPDALYSRGLARMIAPNQDFAEAATLFRQAAERGLPRAQRSLGELYQFGQGVTKDEVEAVKWYRKAADKGDAKAQSDLGSMYFSGLGGLKKDEKEALKWFKKAAEQGDVPGQLSLAAMHITRDPLESVKWFRAAADQGSGPAQFSLGSIYEGRLPGFAANRAEAMVWYTKALQQGYEEARKPLEALQSLRLIPSDQALANLLTRMPRVAPPALAKAARVNDFVSIEIVVDTRGSVKGFKILHGHPLLNEAAIEAIRPMKFKPFLVNEQPVEVLTSITVNFAF